MQAYFRGVVADTTQNSIRAVRSYVREFLGQRLEEAKSVLQGYAQRYTFVMQDALDTARLGAWRWGRGRGVNGCGGVVAGLQYNGGGRCGHGACMHGEWKGAASTFGLRYVC